MARGRAKTSTERSRKYREQHRQDDAYKAKVSADSKKYREANREKTNKAAAARMRKFREKRKLEAEAAANALNMIYIPKETPFKTSQAEGKAWKKLLSSLPYNREQKQYLLAKTSEQEGVQLASSQIEQFTKDPTPLELTVKEFYHREDISRVCPGKKDVRTVKNSDGTKEKVAKQVMQFTFAEAHAIF